MELYGGKTLNIEDCLTILVPLKGRDLETFRLLKYLNTVNCPFKILFADGARDMSDEIVDKYPNLNIEYFFNGPDNTIHDFMAKMHTAFSKIKSPLTIMLDNDDFVSMSGMVRGIKFLSNNENYSSYRDRISPARESRDLYMRSSVTDDCAMDRIAHSIEKRSAGWHDITRSYIHKKLFNVLSTSGTEDLQLVFSLVTYWYTIFGRAYKGTELPYYYHVGGNSLVQGRGIYAKYMDWVKDPHFPKSMCISISAVANCVCGCMVEDIKSVKEKYATIMLKDIYTNNGVSKDILKHDIDRFVEGSKAYDGAFKKILTPCCEKHNFSIDNDMECIDPKEEVQLLRSLI